MEGKLITIIGCESGDWEGLYVNGILHYEGHSIYARDFIDLIKKFKVFKDVECFEITDEHMEELGASFPDDLRDVNINK
jgi:hypothetical protein